MKREKAVWEEDVQSTFAEEYQDLLNVVRFIEGFGLLFVECSPPQGTEIIEKIRQDIPQERVDVLRLDKTTYNFYSLVKDLPNLAEIDVLFVTGLEYSLYQYEEEMKERGLDSNEIISISRRGVPPVLINLNQQRERFRDDFDICFVFLLPRFAVDYLIKRAPDFFDWRSGLFLFPINEEYVRQESLDVCAKELDDYIELTRQQRKYEWCRIKSLLDDERLPVEQKASLLVRKAFLDRKFQHNEEAILACDEALKIQANNYEVWNNKGVALKNLERYEQAVAAYEKALEIKPDYYYAWNNKGDALRNLERYEQAIVAYEKALEIKPDYHYAWRNKGIALFYLERYEQAIAAYEKALEIKPDYHYAWKNKGIALFCLERYEQAITTFEKALEIKPDYHYAWSCKGNTFLQLKLYQQAIAAYEKALEIKPDYHYAWSGKGNTFLKLKLYQQAIAAYEKALEIKPNREYFISNLGLIKYEMGKIDEAIKNWEAAIKINNQFVEPPLAIGVALYKKGENSAGLTMAETVLKLDKSWGNLQRLKKELWGDKLLADAEKLLENPQIKTLLSQTVEEERSKEEKMDGDSNSNQL
ncbi:tetratricopeptide repeat protein [Okeania sp. SIO1I7]|uniref:tetratricopeptide repeat protein n=1 Tax=Okeania sp. SIO1I7 TaxID=2607772 RepID=UPI0013FC3818|nr:tetratricopeptide repeat protein [Okeania sp. SIO1I7]NET27896.1 tetratricopeptide repeat protein [Okeania sp. SIO1I7]